MGRRGRVRWVVRVVLLVATAIVAGRAGNAYAEAWLTAIGIQGRVDAFFEAYLSFLGVAVIAGALAVGLAIARTPIALVSVVVSTSVGVLLGFALGVDWFSGASPYDGDPLDGILMVTATVAIGALVGGAAGWLVHQWWRLAHLDTDPTAP